MYCKNSLKVEKKIFFYKKKLIFLKNCFIISLKTKKNLIKFWNLFQLIKILKINSFYFNFKYKLLHKKKLNYLIMKVNSLNFQRIKTESLSLKKINYFSKIKFFFKILKQFFTKNFLRFWKKFYFIIKLFFSQKKILKKFHFFYFYLNYFFLGKFFIQIFNQIFFFYKLITN